MATIALDFSAFYLSSLRYMQTLQAAAEEAQERGRAAAQRFARAQARSMPGWDALADNIEVWSQDGRLTIGLNDNDLVSAAFQLEYGDETTPPSPFFRTTTPIQNEAQNAMGEYMQETGLLPSGVEMP